MESERPTNPNLPGNAQVCPLSGRLFSAWATVGVLVVSSLLAAGCNPEESSTSPTTTTTVAPCQVKELATGLTIPYGILLDSDDYLVTVDGLIVRIKEDGTVTEVAKTSPESGSGLLRDGENVVVVDNTQASLVRFDSNWQGTTIATGLGNPVGIVKDGDSYVVTDYDNLLGAGMDNGRLLRVKADGQVEEIATKGLGGPGGVVAIDGVYYVTDFDGGRFLKVDPDGTVTEIAKGLGNPVDIKAHGKLFYTADFAGGSSGGRILEVARDGTWSVLDVSGLGSASGIELKGADFIIADISGGRLLKVVECVP